MTNVDAYLLAETLGQPHHLDRLPQLQFFQTHIKYLVEHGI
jgi:hypothetical protein